MGEPGLPTETKIRVDNPDDNQGVAITPDSESRIVTTEEELHGYYIVKAIACAVIDPDRIGYRDAISYFGILCDDNNRKPICRLHFNGQQKYIGLMDANKNEERVPISNLNEIYKQTDRLRATAELYVKQSGA